MDVNCDLKRVHPSHTFSIGDPTFRTNQFKCPGIDSPSLERERRTRVSFVVKTYGTPDQVLQTLEKLRSEIALQHFQVDDFEWKAES